MFAILFGLSTDYQVFLLTQIQEHFKEGKGARATVIEGLGYSGRIIGAAAAVMFCVFGSFVLNGDPTIKQFGLGLATAVAIDAIVVCLFVPALITRRGEVDDLVAPLARPDPAAHQHRGVGVLRRRAGSQRPSGTRAGTGAQGPEQRGHVAQTEALVRWRGGSGPALKRARQDGRCPARTGDLLLVRREQLLRSTAACRSRRSVSDQSQISAALCCGLSLPKRFHMIPLARVQARLPVSGESEKGSGGDHAADDGRRRASNPHRVAVSADVNTRPRARSPCPGGRRRARSSAPPLEQPLRQRGVEASGHRVLVEPRRSRGRTRGPRTPRRAGRVRPDDADVDAGSGSRGARASTASARVEQDADPARAVVDPLAAATIAPRRRRASAATRPRALVDRRPSAPAAARRRRAGRPSAGSRRGRRRTPARRSVAGTLAGLEPRVAGPERRMPGEGQLAAGVKIRTR